MLKMIRSMLLLAVILLWVAAASGCDPVQADEGDVIAPSPDPQLYGCTEAVKLFENGGFNCAVSPANMHDAQKIYDCDVTVDATAWPLLANGTNAGVSLTTDAVNCVVDNCPKSAIMANKTLIGFDPTESCAEQLISGYGQNGACRSELGACFFDGGPAVWPL